MEGSEQKKSERESNDLEIDNYRKNKSVKNSDGTVQLIELDTSNDPVIRRQTLQELVPDQLKISRAYTSFDMEVGQK